MARHRLPDVSPEQYRTFAYAPGFERRWADLGLTTDDLLLLQGVVMHDPTGAPVIPDSGGVRKLRFSPPGEGRGKRDAFRVWYAHLPEFGVIVLVTAYDKAEDADLTADERRRLAANVRRFRDSLARLAAIRRKQRRRS